MFDYKKSNIRILEDDNYIYAIAITSTHPLFNKIFNLCVSYQKLMGLPHKVTQKIWL